jgi:hypothetical protein
VTTQGFRWLANLEEMLPDDQRSVYRSVVEQVIAQRIPFALGGGMAVGVYTGTPRKSKDLDLYVVPSDRERLIGILTGCGLEDYHSRLPYDRGWIYRGNQGEVIVDAIWSMANRRANVDNGWLTRGPVTHVFGHEVRLVPPEELMWSKLYVLQRDRCDWPDILNLLYAIGSDLDWDHLVRRVAEDTPLLRGVLSVFSWMCPEQAASIPQPAWKALELTAPKPDLKPACGARRHDLLDSRPWLLTEIQQTAA